MTQFADAYNNNTATDLFNFSILNYNNLKNKHTVGMNESWVCVCRACAVSWLYDLSSKSKHPDAK